MPIDWLGWAGLGASALQAGGGAYSAIHGGEQGVSWGDIKKNLQYQKGIAQVNRQTRKQMDHERYRRMLKDSKRFKRYAKKMGVSRYALLGNQGSGVVPAQTVPGSTVSPTTKSDTGRSIARMGQDIGRGVASVADIMHTKAETRLLNARADQIINQTQTPKDQDWQSGSGASITEQNIHPGEDLQRHKAGVAERGGQFETQPTITANGIIRNYPSQEIMDLISEDMVSKTLFYKGRLDYAKAMQRGHELRKHKDRWDRPVFQAYTREKQRLEYIFNRKVYWNPTFQQMTRFGSRFGSTGSWQTKEVKQIKRYR